jgi:hypothetical protein
VRCNSVVLNRGNCLAAVYRFPARVVESLHIFSDRGIAEDSSRGRRVPRTRNYGGLHRSVHCRRVSDTESPLRTSLHTQYPSFATMRHFCRTNTGGHAPSVASLLPPSGSFSLPSRSPRRQNDALRKTRRRSCRLDTHAKAEGSQG